MGWITPFEKRHGCTPDISALLCFHFYEKIFYLDFDEKFPSSTEKAGYILGVSMNVGDALTLKILNDDHETTIHRSVVRSAKPRSLANQRILFDANLDPAARKAKDNENLELPDDFVLSETLLPIVRKKKRRYKLNEKNWSKIAETAKASAKRLPASEGIDDRPITSTGVPMVSDASESDSGESTPESGEDEDKQEDNPKDKLQGNQSQGHLYSLRLLQ